MDTGRARRTVWAGTITAFLLVAAFGNQWLWKELIEQVDDGGLGENSGWHIINWLNTPHWVVDTSGIFEGLEAKYVAGYLVGVAALLLAVAVVIGSAASRDGFPAFVTGWFSLVAGGAACTLVSYLISGSGPGVSAFVGEGDDRSLNGTLAVLAIGGGYGLLAGWVVGLACTVAAGGAGRHGSASLPPGGYR